MQTGAHVHAAHLKIVLSDDPTQAEAVLDQMDEAASSRARGLRSRDAAGLGERDADVGDGLIDRVRGSRGRDASSNSAMRKP